jgi:hypothetical protein
MIEEVDMACLIEEKDRIYSSKKKRKGSYIYKLINVHGN